ncbi:MAG: hypothetical protein KAU21_21270 [Gammaproteobacteria bacterium]|nr:hypothetical protein [Gammaproteobacteria bacterium]
MYVTSAVSSLFNPYDIARVAGVKSRSEQPDSRTQQASQQSQPEKVVQGEVLSRQRLQNENISSTNDALANRQFNQQQSGFGFNARQAVNTYIGNQLRGESLDQKKNNDSGSLIDVYV